MIKYVGLIDINNERKIYNERKKQNLLKKTKFI